MKGYERSKALSDSKMFGLGNWHNILAIPDGGNYRRVDWAGWNEEFNVGHVKYERLKKYPTGVVQALGYRGLGFKEELWDNHKHFGASAEGGIQNHGTKRRSMSIDRKQRRLKE